jgi:hypothetical protein
MVQYCCVSALIISLYAVLWLSTILVVTVPQPAQATTSSKLTELLDTHNSHIVLRGGNADWVTAGYQDDLARLTASLKSRYGPHKVAGLVDTLAVMMVFSFELEQPFTMKSVKRLAHLHCSLLRLARNVAPHTKLDVYLWVAEAEMHRLPPVFFNLPLNVNVLPIPKSSWEQPSGSRYNSQWTHGSQSHVDYFLMGRWRNTFGLSFVRAMGYQYMLQLDDDSFITDPIQFDIVSRFREEDCVMGIRQTMQLEDEDIVRGLPEFVRYWMITRNYTSPIGRLYNHTYPHNISGVFSGGWDRIIFLSCFLVLDVNFWYHEVVQDFVNVVLKTGSDLEQRWLEQSVQNMVRLLFVPDENLFVFTSRIYHSKVHIECLSDFSCGSSLRAVGYTRPIHEYLLGTRTNLLVSLDTNMQVYSFVFSNLNSEDEEWAVMEHFMPTFYQHANKYTALRSLNDSSFLNMMLDRWRFYKSYRSLLPAGYQVPNSGDDDEILKNNTLMLQLFYSDGV